MQLYYICHERARIRSGQELCSIWRENYSNMRTYVPIYKFRETCKVHLAIPFNIDGEEAIDWKLMQT